MKSIFPTVQDYLFFFVLWLVVFLSLGLNQFYFVDYPTFTGFQQDSERLVTQGVFCDLTGVDPSNQSLLVVPPEGSSGQPIDSCPVSQLTSYNSSYGLQRNLVTYFGRVFGQTPDTVFVVTRAVVALITSLILVSFAWFFRHDYGLFVTVIVAMLIASSTWLVLYGRNLYWMSFTLFAPMVWSLYLFGNKNTRTWFYLGLFGLFTFKLLMGYEFITNLILSALPSIYYHLIKDQAKLSVYFTHTTLVSVIGVLAFVTALGIHLSELRLVTGSYNSAIESIYSRASIRTFQDQSYARENYLAFYRGNTKVFYWLIDQTIGWNREPSVFRSIVDQVYNVYYYANSQVIELRLFIPIPWPFNTLGFFYATNFSD